MKMITVIDLLVRSIVSPKEIGVLFSQLVEHQLFCREIDTIHGIIAKLFSDLKGYDREFQLS